MISTNIGEDRRRILRRDPHPHLFRPITFRSVTARNRIMMSPMCQYSATDGLSNDWHFVHLGARAAGGAGIVSVEATHVEPRGRITKFCLGLWNDAQRDRLACIARFLTEQGAIPAIQLGHAGRKASVSRPWEGTKPLGAADGGWEPIAPSALSYAAGYPTPREMDRVIFDEVTAAYGASARRAREAGFRILEIHGAHGYLIHQFLSPLSNHRTDEYGGALENRARHLFEVIAAVRAEWPVELPVFLRLSLTDWVQGGWDIGEAIALCRILKARGQVDLIDCSSGGLDSRQAIPTHPGYQLPFSERLRAATGIKTSALGLIHSPELAEEILANNRADIVVLGRALLFDPHWPLHAANKLEARNVPWPVQYERANVF